MPRRRRVALEDFAALQLPLAPTISPDGEHVVFARKSADLARNRYTSHLYRISRRGGRATRLTRGEHVDASPAYSPSGREIAFLSDRAGSTDLWVLPADGGEARRLTSLSGPVSRFWWRPDGRALLVRHKHRESLPDDERARRPSFKHITRLTRKLDGEGWFDDTRWHLYLVTLGAGRVRAVTDGAFDVEDACFSPDGKRVAFISNLEPDADRWPDTKEIYVVRAAGGRPRRITRKGGPKLFVIWPDASILYAGHHGKPGEWVAHDMRLLEVRVRDGRERELAKPLRNWPANMTTSDTVPMSTCTPGIYRVNGESRIALSIQEEGASHVYSMPREGGRLRLELGGSLAAYALGATPDGSAVVAASTMQDAGDLYALTLDGSNDARRITHVNRRYFARIACGEPEETWFRNGRRRIHGWILKPPGFRKGRRYPMLLEIHGGPMAQYGYVFFHELQLLAARGYVVVFTNPRGSSGYGTPWMKAIDGGRWGTVDYDDLMSVTRAMARKPYVDAKRMGVLGGSYGGYMTTLIIGRTRRFRAACTQRQAGNRLIHFGVSDYGWYAQRAAGGRPPWEAPMRYLRQSPNYLAGRMRTPLLIVHSEQDHRCPIVEGEELFTFLKTQGKTVEMIAFEGESHGLSRGGKPQNRLERLRRIADWFDRHL